MTWKRKRGDTMHERDNLKNAQATFPLANTGRTEKDSNVTIPPDADIKEAKDWVDFKEM
jgi:hypothetical protein